MQRIMIGYATDIQERRARVVQVQDVEIAVFKLSDGGFRAIENRCPHKNGKLSEGIVCDHHVFCPLHDWKINLNDGVVQAPDEGCVQPYRVELNEATGQLTLLIEDGSSLAS